MLSLLSWRLLLRLSDRLLQEVPCGSTCKWLPSGTRTTRWFCSSARLKTSPSSSSPSKTKPQKVRVSPRQAGGRREEASSPQNVFAQTQQRLVFLKIIFLAVFIIRWLTEWNSKKERESEFLWWIFFYFLFFGASLFCQIAYSRITGEREQDGWWHVTKFASGNQKSRVKYTASWLLMGHPPPSTSLSSSSSSLMFSFSGSSSRSSSFVFSLYFVLSFPCHGCGE